MAKIGVLGSGSVGQALGLGLVKLGHEVRIGTRDTSKLAEWKEKAGKNASAGSFEDAAKFGHILFICTKWEGTENAINMAGKENFTAKVVVDVTNPLAFKEEGKAPVPAVSYPESASLLLQKMLPKAKVVKAFNSVPAHYMTSPKLKEGTPDLFICGNDVDAKTAVTEIAEKWGWNVINMGGIDEAYLLEGLAMLYIHYAFRNNTWTHAFKLLRE